MVAEGADTSLVLLLLLLLLLLLSTVVIPMHCNTIVVGHHIWSKE